MAPRGFDHFMVHLDAGRNLKLARFTPAERCAWVLGVLPIAARAQVRGAFMVGHVPADANDVALQASVPRPVAMSMLRKARALGMLEPDEDLGAEWVHDFEEHNPEPKRDTTAADRARRYRERQKAKRHDTVTPSSRRDDRDAHGSVTPPEVEGEEKNTPPAPRGGEFAAPPAKPTSRRKRDLDTFAGQMQAYADWLLPEAPDVSRLDLVTSAISFAGHQPTNERVRAIALDWIREDASASRASLHAVGDRIRGATA